MLLESFFFLIDGMDMKYIDVIIFSGFTTCSWYQLLISGDECMWVVLDLYLYGKIESIFNIIDLGLFLMCGYYELK